MISYSCIIMLKTFHPFRIFAHTGYFLQDFNFIKSCFHVMRGTFLNFESYISVEFEIFCQPNSREMTPANFLNYNIASINWFSNMNRVISSNLIILNSFVFTIILFINLLHQFFECLSTNKFIKVLTITFY